MRTLAAVQIVISTWRRLAESPLSLALALCLAAAPLLLGGCNAALANREPQPPDQAFLPGAGETGMDVNVPPPRFGFGRAATPSEIAALDIDVAPDGTGLPPGSGTPAQGAPIYAAQCASCHGADGEGVRGVGDRLVGREPVDSLGWSRTIGNYWPFAPTVFDYIRRAMPFDRPGTLTDDEVYALTAYLLHLNGIIPADATVDAQTLPRVTMPARDRFGLDDRLSSTRVR